VYRLVFLILVILSSCSPVDNTDLFEEYGEYYFSMDCVWRTYNDGQTLWWCSGDIDVELMKGYLFLELLEDNRLSFCGENLSLNTGHSLHDNLVSSLTNNQFNCITTQENELGNEFDWLWYKEDRTLQIIWRPEDSREKQLTLIIESGAPVANVLGTVYYKESP